MKRGGPLKRSDKPMAHGGLPAPTRAQQKLWGRLVDEVGCAVCRFAMGIEDSPAEIHHIVDGQRRVSHDVVLPLCPIHHRQGIQAHPSRHSVNGCHGGLDAFEQAYGSERTLLEACERWIGHEYSSNYHEDRLTDDETTDTDHRDSDPDADDQSDDGDARQEVERLQTFDSPVHIRITHHRARLCDPDNLNAKGVIDAIVAAKILRDDSAKYVQSIRHDQVKVKSYADEKTVLTIEEVI